MNANPIGIFDSGCGGMTVLQSLIKLLPDENYVYVSDSNGSWGNLPPDVIYARARECVKVLIKNKCKIAVAACNTATAVAAERLRAEFNLPIVGTEPALKAAVAAFPNKRVTVFCTQATANGGKLRKAAALYSGVTVQPLPELAAEVESKVHNLISLKPEVERIAKLYPSYAVVLGCTHYVYLRKFFEECYGSGRVFDGNSGVANRVKGILCGDINLSRGGKINFCKI